MKAGYLKLSALLTFVAAVPLAHGQAPSPGRAAPAAATAAPRSITVREALVTMFQDVNVPATELGMITAIHVTEGQQVDEQTLLADIDNREALAKQLIARGEVEAAQAQAASTAEIEVAEKAIDVAQAELDSMEEIRTKNPGAVSLTELRKFRFQLERAQAQLKLALTEQNIARLTAKVKTTQLQAIEIELDRLQIKAPFKGEVVELHKRRGEWATAGEPILHLVRMDKVRVKGFVYLSSGVAPDDVEGKPVEIVVSTAGGKQHTVKGTIGYASRVIEGVGNHRTFRVWADVDNQKVIDPVTKKEGWAIQPGTTADMTIDLTPPKPAPAPAAPARPAATPAGKTAPAPTTPMRGASRVETRKPASQER
jgi:multidrug efflux pump subunit AcrA (membrane-fusion protein)